MCGARAEVEVEVAAAVVEDGAGVCEYEDEAAEGEPVRDVAMVRVSEWRRV